MITYCDNRIIKEKLGFGCVILENGDIIDAIPSHERAVINCCHISDAEKDVLLQQCKETDSCFLAQLSRCYKLIFVYDTQYVGMLNSKQRQQMVRLKLKGLYKGLIGEVGDPHYAKLGGRRKERITYR